MGVYSINPKTKIGVNNILNIMIQLLMDINDSMQYNIIDENKYLIVINNVNTILNNYLKIYNYYNYGIKNMFIQIYNQSIELVLYVNITLDKYKYYNFNSTWNNFITGLYNNQIKIIYQELTLQEKNDLRYAIISGDIYYISKIDFIYNGTNTSGIIIKPKMNYNVSYNNMIYIYTVYWN